MRPKRPHVFKDNAVAAYQAAIDRNEPVFVPTCPYTDDRGWSMMNLLQGVLSDQGQINFSVQYPSVIKAWHRHQNQTDFWVCLQGHIKAGIYDENQGRAWHTVIGEKNPGVLIIPPPLWHGAATVGPTSAGLLYYVTCAYDPDHPDEERRAHDSVEGFPWGVQHG